MPTQINDNLITWAEDLETAARLQAERTSRLPILAGPVALMADAHHGIGATVGSVVATDGALIPSCVGVDIGCGMIGALTTLTVDQLPDDLSPLLAVIEKAVPAGVGRGHDRLSPASVRRLDALGRPPATTLDNTHARRVAEQFGTLGAGNHFLECDTDPLGRVWLVLHSGSRNIGNEIARGHIAVSKRVARASGIALEDPELAWLAQGTPEFDAYVADLLWAQRYAYESRDVMMGAALDALYKTLGMGRAPRPREVVNCHHNYAALEVHDGRQIWVTRKGAIRAGVGDRGIIPGSMGTSTYIVRGKGNEASYCSSSHGAGRVMSRTKARASITDEQLRAAMDGKTWLIDRAESLRDEAPQAYKDITRVMELQADLVEVELVLNQVLNYKGTS